MILKYSTNEEKLLSIVLGVSLFIAKKQQNKQKKKKKKKKKRQSERLLVW